MIGLVGGIGAGKSAAAAAFATRGGHVINADALGHAALEVPDVRDQVLARWGGQASLLREDGRLDRRAIARIVFADAAELRALEAMVFPYIGTEIRRELEKAEADPGVRFVVLDAAVMLEAGWNGVCDHLVYVDAPRPLRLARLAARSGWTETEVLAREASQMPAEEKRRRAEAVLRNDGSPGDLQTQVDRLLQLWAINVA